MKYKEVEDAVTRVLDEAGIMYTKQWRSKHPSVNFTYDGKNRKIWLPASPSDGPWTRLAPSPDAS